MKDSTFWKTLLSAYFLVLVYSGIAIYFAFWHGWGWS